MVRPMSFVGAPFDYDVFISYSHGDALREGSSRLGDWSKAFAEALEQELRAFPRMGEALKLFFDVSKKPGQAVDPLQGLSPGLQAAAGASAILTVLLSPQYLDSDWCRLECEWWEKQQKAVGLACSERIALTRIWPLFADQKVPALFADAQGVELPGFWFYDREQAELYPQPLGWASVEDREFKKALLGLAGHLKLKLEKLRDLMRQRERELRDARALGGQSPVLYLHARDTDAERWERACEELSSNGFTVVPGEPDHVEPDPERALKRRSERVATLGECDALLLLASGDGFALDADLIAVGRNDRNSAKARSNRLLPGAVLDPIGTIRTPQRSRTARGVQVDWIDANPAACAAVRQWLTEKSEAGSVRA
jgi:hypothetical protein